MDLTGEYVVPASRAEVWDAINDPDVLKACIPGAESLDKVSDTRFDATVAAKVGPVKARFSGTVSLGDLDPPNGCTISGEGKGGAAGFARGTAKVRLEDAPGGGTRLSYSADVQVGGKLAQIGSRLVQGTARKMADDFFGALAARLGGGAAPAAPAPSEAAAAAAPAGQPATARGIAAHWWIPAVIAAIVVLLLVVSRLG